MILKPHLFREYVHSNRVFTRLGPKFDLSQNLVSEGIAHDKARVTHCTPQVDKTTLGQKNDIPAIRQLVTINLEDKK